MQSSRDAAAVWAYDLVMREESPLLRYQTMSDQSDRTSPKASETWWWRLSSEILMAGLSHLPSIRMSKRMDAVVEEAQQLAVQASLFLHGMVCRIH